MPFAQNFFYFQSANGVFWIFAIKLGGPEIGGVK